MADDQYLLEDLEDEGEEVDYDDFNLEDEDFGAHSLLDRLGHGDFCCSDQVGNSILCCDCSQMNQQQMGRRLRRMQETVRTRDFSGLLTASGC